MHKDKVTVIDYPPGGLGNLVAQILTNEDLVVTGDTTFHNNKNKHKWYVSILDDSIDTSASEISVLKEKLRSTELIGQVVCVHTYDHTDALLDIPNIVIYQVVVNELGAILFYNKHLKIYKYSGDSAKKLHLLNTRWDTKEPWVEREFLALELKYQQSISNVPFNVDYHVEFDNFYKSKESFIHEVRKLKPTANVERLYKVFCETQEPILSRFRLVTGIIEDIKQGIDRDISHLEVLEQAVIAGLLNKEYNNFEWQLPNKNTWFQTTGEIINIIKTL